MQEQIEQLADNQAVAAEEAANAAAQAQPLEQTITSLITSEHNLPDSVAEAMDTEGAAPHRRLEANHAAITAWLFQPGATPRNVPFSELPDLTSVDANFVWIDISEYQQADLRALGEQLHLPEGAQRSTIGPWQRPALSVFGDQFYVTVTVARADAEARRVQASQLDLFVGPNFLVSAHKQALPFAEQILVRAQTSPQLLQLDSVFMLYLILDELIAYYERLSEHVEDDIERMEERALTDNSDDFLNELLRFKRFIFALSRLVNQHRPLLAAFRRPDFTFVQGAKVETYYRDLEDRLDDLLAFLLPAKDAVNSTFDIYVSQVSHRTNYIMKLLTLVSTILLPITVIVGIFGTSFQGVPLYNTWDFALMILIIVAVAGAILVMFRRNGWI